MMSRVILVTGGCRSGKSAHAQKLGESLAGRHAYVATCPVIDDEIGVRVEEHRRQRADGGWETIEETVGLAEAIASAKGFDVLLVDCLTLWVNNIMYEAEQRGGEVTEEDITNRCGEVLSACGAREGTIVFVTNEVGMGIVPGNGEARRYRDLLGRCNQVIAGGADEVRLVSCGIPIILKGATP